MKTAHVLLSHGQKIMIKFAEEQSIDDLMKLVYDAADSGRFVQFDGLQGDDVAIAPDNIMAILAANDGDAEYRQLVNKYTEVERLRTIAENTKGMKDTLNTWKNEDDQRAKREAESAELLRKLSVT